MTRRVIRAIEHPSVNIIGHLTDAQDRLAATPIDLDLEAVFEAAGRTGTALEINCLPGPARPAGRARPVGAAARREVRDRHRRARDRPSRVMRFGVATAQRGWLTKDDVINAWPLAKLAAVPAQGAEVAALSRRRLPRAFFDRPAVEVAPALLGRVLVRRLPDGARLAGTRSSRPRRTSRVTRRATASGA